MNILKMLIGNGVHNRFLQEKIDTCTPGIILTLNIFQRFLEVGGDEGNRSRAERERFQDNPWERIDKDWEPRYVKDHHKGIVDRKTWERVQNMMKRRRT